MKMRVVGVEDPTRIHNIQGSTRLIPIVSSALEIEKKGRRHGEEGRQRKEHVFNNFVLLRCPLQRIVLIHISPY